MRLRISIRGCVRPFVCPSVGPSVRWSESGIVYHHIGPDSWSFFFLRLPLPGACLQLAFFSSFSILKGWSIVKVICFTEQTHNLRGSPKGNENFSHFALRRTVYKILTIVIIRQLLLSFLINIFCREIQNNISMDTESNKNKFKQLPCRFNSATFSFP